MGALDSNITVADLRPTLQKWTDPSSIENPPVTLTPTNGPNFVPRLNQVCQRLDREGLWKGVCQEVWFAGATLGYITLPRRCLTVQGADIGGVGMETFTRFNEYKLKSLGWKQASEYNNPSGWTDMGDGYCTTVDIDPDAPATIRVKITNAADAGKVIHLFGLDEDGAEIYDNTGGAASGSRGITLTTANPSATTSRLFTSLDGISAAVMKYPWSICMVVNGVETTLGSYEPGETKPKYRRYKTGVITAETIIRVFARRRTVDLVDETDPVLPADYAAIEFGLRARALEDADHQADADVLWTRAIQELDNQIKGSRGRVTLTMPFRPALPRALPMSVR